MKRTLKASVVAGLALTGLVTVTSPAFARVAPGDFAGQVAPHPRPPAQVGPGRVQSAPSGRDASNSHLSGEGAHEEGPKAINWTDFSNKDQPPYLAALINFAILGFVYVYFGRAPIASALKSRRAEVSKQIEEAQRIKHEAETRSKQYASKLEDLGQELGETKAALAAAGANEKARIVREAEEKAVRMEKDAVFLLEQERKQMQNDLQRETVSTALSAAEILLRTRLTLADQERVAEEFLATLVPPKATGAAPGGAS